MEKQKINIETYRYDNDYYIDIIETSEYLEAWIYNKNYGIKMLMFGTPILEQSYSEFIELAETGAPAFIKYYKEDYED